MQRNNVLRESVLDVTPNLDSLPLDVIGLLTGMLDSKSLFSLSRVNSTFQRYLAGDSNRDWQVKVKQQLIDYVSVQRVEHRMREHGKLKRELEYQYNLMQEIRYVAWPTKIKIPIIFLGLLSIAEAIVFHENKKIVISLLIVAAIILCSLAYNTLRAGCSAQNQYLLFTKLEKHQNDYKQLEEGRYHLINAGI